MLERDLQKNITAWLKAHNIPYYKTTGGLMRGSNGVRYASQPGYPDLEIFYKGQVILVELKNEKGQLRDSQIEVFQKLLDQGINVWIMRPQNWKYIVENYEPEKDLWYLISLSCESYYSWVNKREK